MAADDGAGPYDVDSPGFADYWKEFQANGISNSGDFIGKTDVARHMDHYLKGTGQTLDLDVDRMLSDEDDMVLRDTSAATRAKHEEEWRRQALDAFAQSGGKPVAIPVETTGQGYTHDRGPDGKPQISIDYQVNVWDRYSWDPGKATPIGPTTVTDADTARMHTTGQAREFDMRGSSSVQQHDMSSGGSWPDPKEPGRDGTRTDIGRNGDAR
ncbi:hypothetical protein [Streptomyces sp. NPDC046161]|uniref:hypothetical protein n=1 Tax=Streptomyces sp. NPDC046161 TaxID=3155132 RepID=UPI0033E9C68E